MSQFKRNLAIIIGINNYQSGIPQLKTATKDANKIAKVLERQHGYKIWGLLDEQATLANCLRMLEEFLPGKIKKSDRLIFYFAGHGIALNGDDGPEGFLIPQDARLGDTSTYLPMVRLQKALDKLPCRHFLTILDCCFAGAFRWSSMRKLLVVPDVIHRQHYDRFLESAAWQVITSASHNQTASDSLALTSQEERGVTSSNHSPFAAALIEALNGNADSSPPAKNGSPPGDGIITATELYLYLRDRVEVATEKSGTIQTPGLYPLNKHDRGEYIFHSPGKKLNLSSAPPLDESQNPYRGLESFDAEHSELFFGRQALTQKLYQFCDKNPLTVVLGASGTGKSSLVKAGLVSYLQQNKEISKTWRILPPIRPGESVFKALNKTLTEYQSSGSSILLRDSLEKKKILWGKIKYIFNKNPHTKLLLVIDQAEELTTLAQDSSEKDDFLNLLNEWLTKYPQRLRIVLTLRSDFEPQFRDRGLKSFWQQARFIVPAMTREELREAIEKPAAARVMYFEPYSLVDRLIDEVAQMPGALPLLSFALSELYLKYLQKFRAGIRDKRAIVKEDYREIGGVTQSLTQRADLEYNKLVQQDPACAETIRYVMLRTIAVGGGELARRRVPLSELKYPAPEDLRVKKIIKSFSAARLLVEGQDAEMNPYVEPAHDALVRGWQKLLQWRKEEQESLLLQRRLTPVAEEWKNLKYQQKQSAWRSRKESAINWLDAGFYAIEKVFYITRDSLLGLVTKKSDEQHRWMGKPEQYLWNTNPYLNVLKEKLESNDYLFNQIEAEFLKISIRRKRNKRRISIAFATMVMLIIGIAALVAIISAINAHEARQEAEESRNEAITAQNELTKAVADNKEKDKALAKLSEDLKNGKISEEKYQKALEEREQEKEEAEQKLQNALEKSDLLLTRFSKEDKDKKPVEVPKPDDEGEGEGKETKPDDEGGGEEEETKPDDEGGGEGEETKPGDEGEGEGEETETTGEGEGEGEETETTGEGEGEGEETETTGEGESEEEETETTGEGEEGSKTDDEGDNLNLDNSNNNNNNLESAEENEGVEAVNKEEDPESTDRENNEDPDLIEEAENSETVDESEN